MMDLRHSAFPQTGQPVGGNTVRCLRRVRRHIHQGGDYIQTRAFSPSAPDPVTLDGVHLMPRQSANSEQKVMTWPIH